MGRARWPGWTRQHTLLLPVPPEEWPPPEAPVTVDGLTLHPKRELHITLVGNQLGKALRIAAQSGDVERDAVRAAFEREDWRWSRTGRRTLLRAAPKRRGGPERHALVEHVDLPAMARFHATRHAVCRRDRPGHRVAGRRHAGPPCHWHRRIGTEWITARSRGLADAAAFH